MCVCSFDSATSSPGFFIARFFPLVQKFIIIIISRLMYGVLCHSTTTLFNLASVSCWLLLALFYVTFIFKFNSLQLNRFKSPLELEEIKKREWEWEREWRNRTKERRVAEISKIRLRGSECVYIRNVHQTVSTSKSKTFCFLRSNANCTFRPVISEKKRKNTVEQSLRQCEFPFWIEYFG